MMKIPLAVAVVTVNLPSPEGMKLLKKGDASGSVSTNPSTELEKAPAIGVGISGGDQSSSQSGGKVVKTEEAKIGQSENIGNTVITDNSAVVSAATDSQGARTQSVSAEKLQVRQQGEASSTTSTKVASVDGII